jgi:hypothetical protein
MTQLDILFCSAPGTFTNRPTLAPALLKSCAISAGFSARAIDLNIEINNQLNKSTNKTLLQDFFREQKIHPEITNDIADLVDYCALRILEYNPRILGLSLLTQDSQFFTIWLCYHLKFLCPNLKILIGGSGIKTFIAESKINFAEILIDRGYIDNYINGDGEYSVVEYLKENYSYPGINTTTWNPITNLNQLPYPNFDDYNFSDYAEPGIPICDSRGCVRTCEFCDIIEHWKKYQYRTAENIFNEMLHQIERYDLRKFYFYNSLTNGNMKEFRRLLDFICDYNDQHPTKPISWDGYFIVRTQQQHPEEFWQKIKKSNGFLQLGIESLIEPVRIGLGKNFSNQDIEYHLIMAKQYQVPIMLLLIVGYPTETREDFEFTKQWFRDHAQYAQFPVKSIVFSLAAILPGTQLEKKQEQYNIVKGAIPTIWITPTTNISTQGRVDYYNHLNQLLTELGFNCSDGNSNTISVALSESSYES